MSAITFNKDTIQFFVKKAFTDQILEIPWKVINYTNDSTINAKMLFPDPSQISTLSEKDYLIMRCSKA
jgi:hypothetical protein